MDYDGEYLIHSIEARPDLGKLHDSEQFFDSLWPDFLEGNTTGMVYLPKLGEYDGLKRFQYVAVWKESTGQETLVACGNSVPFFWPELDTIGGRNGLASHPEVLNTLPDGGFDTILSRGVEQYLARQGLPPLSPPLTQDQVEDMPTRQLSKAPNALSAVAIVIDPKHRSRGLAEKIIQHMKQTARKENFHSLVVPLRPTRKADHPLVEMVDYIAWMKGSDPTVCNRQVSDTVHGVLPFDPWLRKHVSLGGRVIKVANQSMTMQGSVSDWQLWTGIDVEHVCKVNKGLKNENENDDCVEICIPGGLVPLKVYPKIGDCIYIEPNVWLYHGLEASAHVN